MESFTIKESYKIQKSSEIRLYIEENKYLNPTNVVLLNRSIDSLVDEWEGHNLLYNLHLFRSHTADVDFEYPLKWYFAFIWKALTLFYWK